MKRLRDMLVVEKQEGLIELQNRKQYLTENVNKTEIEENRNEIIKDIISKI